jgi:amino acid transporter
LAKPSRLTLGPLVAVMFFTVSGGPFGLEGLVGSVGPGLALLLLVVTPLVYSVPEALLIGELASALPEEGGYYVWVKRAFGPFWGMTNGWFSWAYSLIDMAIYPVLLQQYLAWFLPGLSFGARWLVSIFLIWLATWLNLRGTRVVGLASGWFTAVVLLPFALLSGIALYRWLGAPGPVALPIHPFHVSGVSLIGALGVGISQSIWNYSGWDNPSTLGGEIDDAGRTYPRALRRALPLVTAVYLVCVLPVLALTSYQKWTDGAWPALANELVGRWLADWVSAVGMLSAFALFNALLLSYSRVPLVLARDGFLPKALAGVDERGTPRTAVIVSAIVYSLFALASFGDLLTADVLLYTAALALEFAALLHFRRHEPELRGAFRVPLGRLGLAALALLPILLIGLSVVLQLLREDHGPWSLLGTVAFGAAGPVVYGAVRVARELQRRRA